MPLFGRFGDDLGKARLLLIGVIILIAGTLLIYFADTLLMIFVGRIIQGIGASGSTPLSLAILAQRFPEEERGRAMATWNLAAPGTSIIAPSLSGLLVDSFGWRTILIPVFVIAIAAFFIVRYWVPTLRGKPNWLVLRQFDWGGHGAADRSHRLPRLFSLQPADHRGRATAGLAAAAPLSPLYRRLSLLGKSAVKPACRSTAYGRRQFPGERH